MAFIVFIMGITFCFHSAASYDTRVLNEFVNHPALKRLDLKFCGAFSHSQTSRGPLGCGYPVVGDHPWLVALGFKTPQSGLVYACSGVLITPTIVLTSARCARGAKDYPLSQVRLGEFDLKAREDCVWYEKLNCQRKRMESVNKTLLHPTFIASSATHAHAHDIALLRLTEPAHIDHQVQTVCLPIFASRPPPNNQFALSFGLQKNNQITELDGHGKCCVCSRDRNSSTFVMDEERLFKYDAKPVSDNIPCFYRVLSLDGSTRCLGSGTPCIADTGAPYVGVDRFGGSFYVLGVTSTRPTPERCEESVGSVNYAPVKENLRFILDGIEKLSRS